MQKHAHAFMLSESICPNNTKVFHYYVVSDVQQQHLGHPYQAFMPNSAEAHLKLIMVDGVLTRD